MASCLFSFSYIIWSNGFLNYASEFYCALWVTMLLANHSFFSMFLMQIVMSNLRGESNGPQMYESEDQGIDELMKGTDDPDWDLWEEWMGWEGAGIRDYSSHINPYI